MTTIKTSIAETSACYMMPSAYQRNITRTRALPLPRKYGLERVQTRNFLCK